MLWALLFGFLFGFIGSMPLAGPIAVLVFGRGLRGRFRSGMLIALGAALAESFYAFLAYWGLSRLLDAHPVLVLVSRAVAATILLGLGAFFVTRHHPAADQPGSDEEHEKSSFTVGFLITV